MDTLTLTCESETCVIGLNQSYDTAWVGFIMTDSALNILPHMRLNNWANAWQVPSGSQKITVVYLPELAQLFFLSSLGATTILTVILLMVSVVRKK